MQSKWGAAGSATCGVVSGLAFGVLGVLLLAVPAQATLLRIDLSRSGSQDTGRTLGGWTFDPSHYSVLDAEPTGGSHVDSIESLIASAKDAISQLGDYWNVDFGSWRHFERRWHERRYVPTSAVPEPTAALVFGAGLLVVGAATRRRR